MEISNEVLFSIFMSLEGLHAYSAFLPSIMTIGTFVDSPEKVRMIREGQLIASGYLALLAGSVSYMIKSWWPLIMAFVAGTITLAVYEYALRSAPAKEQEPSYFG